VAIPAFDFAYDWWNWADKAGTQRILQQTEGAWIAVTTGQTATKKQQQLSEKSADTNTNTSATLVIEPASVIERTTRELRSTHRELQ